MNYGTVQKEEPDLTENFHREKKKFGVNEKLISQEYRGPGIYKW